MPRNQSSRLGAFESKLIREALISSVLKLNLRQQIENPVMFTVEIGGILTTISFLISFFSATTEFTFFVGSISLWLWLTVLFSNFAESLSEGWGKARAASIWQPEPVLLPESLHQNLLRVLSPKCLPPIYRKVTLSL